MLSVADQLQAGIIATRSGETSTARRYFLAVLKHEPRNETAWLWLAKVMQTLDLALRCIEHLLTINPHSTPAREARDVLQLRIMLDEAGITEPQTATTPQKRRYMLGEALVEAAVITQPQLNQALQYQAQQALLRTPQPLGAILVQLRYVRTEQIEAALAAQVESTLARPMSSGVGMLGEFLVREGAITVAQLHQALARQSMLRQVSRAMLLGDVLVEMGYIQRGDLNRAVLQWHDAYEMAW